MDETNYVNENNQQMSYDSTSQMVVSESSREKMASMGKWMKFIGIVGIIVGLLIIVVAIGIIVLLAIGSGEYGGGLAEGGIFGAVIYFAVGGIAIYLAYLLYRAGKKYKKASALSDSNQLDDAISDQNTYFSCTGVLTIVYLVIIVIAFFFGLLGAF